MGALEGIRVIDASCGRGERAGRVLADLGAEVIQIEPPGGVPARRLPPFEVGEDGDPGASLCWATLGLGKRSVVLDVFDASENGGADRLRELLRTADVFIESFEPGELAAVGLDPATACDENPALIYTSVTPFGQDGPLAGAPATDLCIEAAGGLLGLQGDPDRPPLPAGFPQAFLHAGVQAAADITVALNERLHSGRGQHLDVSAQAAVVWTLMDATGYPPIMGRNPPGTSEFRTEPRGEVLPGLTFRGLVPIADGHALVALGLAGQGERTVHALMGWARRSGELPEDLSRTDWRNCLRDAASGELPIDELRRAADVLYDFLAKRTGRELQAFAVKERVLLAPIFDLREVYEDVQLAARNYWTPVAGRVHPGPFARLSETPVRMNRGAPELGEGQSLLDEPCEPRPLRREEPARSSEDGAFAGLRVADFSWVGVGPIIAKALGDQGATVVRVESQASIDITRQLPPFVDGVPHIDKALFFANFNTSKLGLALDLSTTEGRKLALELADWADVVLESFTPGTMKRFGLDWESLSAGRPELVMLSTSLRGQDGPEAAYTGFGMMGSAIAGLTGITGWPDRPPVGPWSAYTDGIAPRFGLAALAAALYHRAQTGKGQYIDLSQIEAAIHFLEPLALDYSVNGRIAGGRGHSSPYACPHGVYATIGRERYIAIAVVSAEQWDALESVGLFEPFGDPALRQLDARIEQRKAIEARLAQGCADRDAFELAQQLRDAGVPAYAVLRPSDLYEDPQLLHREFFVTLDHAAMGPRPFNGPATKFSRTPALLRRPGPILGEHTQVVLRDILGLTDEQISEFAIAGALT
ncbi:MAG: hypothetical protein CL908_13245 [Deltaproteobacteria bacterium]|nr:hypothetical protein [Deltaproteobacteria bacterium]